MGRTRDRMNNQINAGSMADIAFLLLIFFLVTTTIAEDKGITVKLPPWSDDVPDATKMKTRNVYSVLVNSRDQLLVRGEQMNIRELKESAKNFIVNPANRDDMAEKPTKAIISLKNDRGTSYKAYLDVYNELKAAYNELWDDLCLVKYGINYSEELPSAYKKAIKSEIPFVLSEAEPTAFGEE